VILVPRNLDLKIPSDLLGIKPIDYPAGDVSTIKARLGPACTELRALIKRLGPI
jgi:predicted nucleotide-binding protein